MPDTTMQPMPPDRINRPMYGTSRWFFFAKKRGSISFCAMPQRIFETLPKTVFAVEMPANSVTIPIHMLPALPRRFCAKTMCGISAVESVVKST